MSALPASVEEGEQLGLQLPSKETPIVTPEQKEVVCLTRPVSSGAL